MLAMLSAWAHSAFCPLRLLASISMARKFICLEKFRSAFDNLLRSTSRNARIAALIPLEYSDVMHKQSLRIIIPSEFSDAMITEVVCKWW